MKTETIGFIVMTGCLAWAAYKIYQQKTKK
jgi:hypothetical protein